jgi:uncharacterized integral membrane protein
MFRVILSIVLLVVLVVLIVLNLGYTTSFNLFGWKFESIPVTAVALVSFAVGILYSFAYYFGRYLNKVSKKRFQKRGEQVKVREQELKDKEKELSAQIEKGKKQLPTETVESSVSVIEPSATPAKKKVRARKKGK